ncbi:MAG: 4Fe-4S binding protein, partial [Deltaproteobacteria bacterium]|nr:4Fe-4S binding protein [Deltaproteobacteria bacterium]
VCPIGTMSNWVGKNRRPLLLAPERCTECNLCVRTCPMQLAPVALKEQGFMPHRGDCLKCSLCVGNCPTAALTLQPAQKQAA